MHSPSSLNYSDFYGSTPRAALSIVGADPRKRNPKKKKKSFTFVYLRDGGAGSIVTMLFLWQNCCACSPFYKPLRFLLPMWLFGAGFIPILIEI
jgi:hypothetical protein